MTNLPYSILETFLSTSPGAYLPLSYGYITTNFGTSNNGSNSGVAAGANNLFDAPAYFDEGDRVRVADHASLDGTSMSMCCWFKCPNITEGPGVACRGDSPSAFSDRQANYRISPPSRSVQGRWFRGGSANQVDSTGSDWEYDTWTFFAATYVSGAQKLYINDEIVATGTITGSLNNPSGDSAILSIGEIIGSSTSQMVGNICHLGWWGGKVLTDVEVEQIYVATARAKVSF